MKRVATIKSDFSGSREERESGKCLGGGGAAAAADGDLVSM